MGKKSSVHLNNKKTAFEFLYDLANSTPANLKRNLAHVYHSDAHWRGSYPMNEMQGLDSVEQKVWRPLLYAFPDLERRDSIFTAGDYEGRDYIAAIGHYAGTFRKSWLDIPPTGGVLYLRYGEVHQMKEGKIVQSTVLIDVLDFIRQAGFWPIAPGLGYEGMWPAPITRDGIVFEEQDPKISASSIKQTLNMHRTLSNYDDLKKLSREDLLSMPQKEHWHPKMMWYGPSGIGTCRGLEGFVDFHQLPFRIALPNRVVAGHYIRIGDGRISVTGGWPSVKATHLGNNWLGLTPTGRDFEMRVMDFYLHHEGLIRENWVPIDMVHVLLQLGFDVLERVKYQFAPRFN